MSSSKKKVEQRCQTIKSDLNLTDPHKTNPSSTLFDLRTTNGQIVFLLVTIAISSLVQLLPKDGLTNSLKLFTDKTFCNGVATNEITIEKKVITTAKKPIYWIYGKSSSEDHLKHVNLVLKRLGFEHGSNESDWDLLWAHDYPFRALYPTLQHHLKPHQKVNHLPGCGFITNKVDLATSDLKYIPKAFKLPADREPFLDYANANARKLFVQKNNQHRHIYVRNLTEIDYNSNDTFLQEYIDNPLLVDGYKFDIGVYVIITSVDPLRVYIYTGDVLFRYCTEPYYPFDANDLKKYVVGDDYLPTWEVPSLRLYHTTLGFGQKDSFDAYLRSKNRDPDRIWAQVEDAIRLAIVNKEHHIVNILKNLSGKRNFFEMMRFDLVIDDNEMVYLLEANMSPNLSSAHFLQNTLLYEQVIYNLLNLVGVGVTIERESMRQRIADAETMISADKNIVVFAEQCSQPACLESCAPIQCNLCLPCLSADERAVLHVAYREHTRKGNTKRIFPPPIIDKKLDIVYMETLSQTNQMILKWFYGKCLMESSWCA